MEVFEAAPQAITQTEIKPAPPLAENEFKPTGAIAFFIAFVILGLAIWFGIYFLMLNRN